MNEFGDFLYTLRKEKGLTQIELANSLKVTNKAVSKWETGEAMPETSLLLPLSKILGVTVDELLQGKRATEEGTKSDNNINGNNKNNDNGFSDKDDNKKSNINNEETQLDNCCGYKHITGNINDHIFTKAKDEEKTFLEKIGGAVCATVCLTSLTAYFFIGILFNYWTPYWVIIPVSALSCGIIGIVFGLFDAKKKEQKIKKGENIYIGSVCGIVMLLCIITYLLLGAIWNLWHPYWIIIICGMAFCGIVGSFAEVFKHKNKAKGE